METTICPWCQTEIVWDEEIGPEEECPHCHNELEGYRTLNISLDSEDEEEQEQSYDASQEKAWESDEEEFKYSGTRGTYAPEGTDLIAYESMVSKVLETQDQVPECPHCREFMLYTGNQNVTEQDFESIVPGGQRSPLIQAPFTLNLYVCPSCFNVSRFLSEEDRAKMVRQTQSK